MSIYFNDAGNPMIYIRYKGWKALTTGVFPYFNHLYGIKYKKMINLSHIFDLIHKLSEKELSVKQREIYVIQIIKYYICFYEDNENRCITPIKFTQDQQELYDSVNIIHFEDNDKEISFLWFMGFFLGDGSLYTSLRYREIGSKIHTISIHPLLVITQLKIKENIPFINKIANMLTSIGCKSVVIDASAVGRRPNIRLVVEGIKVVIDQLLPLFPIEFLY